MVIKMSNQKDACEIGVGSILVDPETNEVIMDEYMDPMHLELGDDGYKLLQKEKVIKTGTKLLEYIQTEHPEYHASFKKSKREFHASPEGRITEDIYKIRTRHSGLWSWLIPKTLVIVSKNNGMMSSAIIDIKDILKDDEELYNLAKSLGKEFYFRLE